MYVFWPGFGLANAGFFYYYLDMKKFVFIICALVFGACVGQYVMPARFDYEMVECPNHDIATWQKNSDNSSPVHIYIEGDGRAFYTNGRPTNNPTPRDSFVRKMAEYDSNPNVAYIARPCQFITDDNCNVSTWTRGRFSADNIDAMACAIKYVANGRPIVLIGFSGGAMVSGLVITQHPEIYIKKWITIAGVLNHHDWTNYFGDSALDASLDLYMLPNVPQIHYVGADDSVVPMSLSRKWIGNHKMKIVRGATHYDFPIMRLDFD